MPDYYKLIIIIGTVAGLLILSQPQVKAPLPAVDNRQIFATSVEIDPIIQIPEAMPLLNVSAALVKNLTSNFYFFESETSRHWPLASLTKLLTSVVALEEIGYTDEIKLLVEQMMVISDNSAAEKVAEIYGNKQEFVKKMNIKAEDLGMKQTSIFEPTGLSFLNQSTVNDLEILADYIIKNHSFILQASRQPKININGKELANINRFAGEPNFMGGKTGFTDEASGNLLSIFQYQGQPILIIVFGTKGYEERFEQTQILFQWISKFYKSSKS